MENDRERNSNILIIDDDQVQRMIMTRVAQMAGYNVYAAETFEDGEQLLLTWQFNTVVVDLSLGERDGVELLRVIAELPVVPRVFLVSGCERRILDATVRMARASGIIDVQSLPKPLDLDLLKGQLLASAVPRDARTVTERMSPIVSATQIERGMANHEFTPVFQPKINLTTGRLIGCEVLTRWNSKELGFIPPDVFIPIAETTGQIARMTEAVLRDSLTAARGLIQENSGFVLAVNLSAAMLSDLTLPEQIERILAETQVSGRSLILEVTETAAMADVNRAIDILIRLRLKGIGLAIDDFGTGYSSLSALARMPFSELKIDYSFVHSCQTDQDMWKVVRASIAMAHELDMKVVAEGIENLHTWELLKSADCDIGQGYHFARPLSYDDLLQWERTWRSADRENTRLLKGSNAA
jgi:EAL domain-containing protein (putative c-di-GMP-specific phosphodiesterase class I)/FixJ family two-component response regulator